MAVAALCACGCLLARRLPEFRYRHLAIGLLFGGVSIAADHLPVAAIDSWGIDIVLRDAPVMAAGFFFGPVAAAVAGAVAVGGGLANLAFAAGGFSVVSVSAVATLLVTLYTFVLARWVFDGRPSTVVSLIAALYGVLLHEMAVGALVMVNYEQTLEVIVRSLGPVSAGTVLAIGASSLACGILRRGWSRQIFSSLNVGFLFFGIAVTAIGLQVGFGSKRQSERILRGIVENLESSIEDQLNFMLHRNGETVLASLGATAAPSRDALLRLARLLELDLMTVVSPDGLIVASTETNAPVGTSFFDWSPSHGKYRALLEGKAHFLVGPFERTAFRGERVIKCAALPTPAGGFVQLGYGWETLAADFERHFMEIFERREIGESGYFLICDERGRLIHSVRGHPDSKGRSLEAIGFGVKDLAVTPGTCFRARVFDVWSRCIGYDTIGPWRFYAVLPLAEHQGPALLTLFVAALVLFAVFLAFRLVLLRVRRAQEKIDDLRAREERRRTDDLELARTIQRSELPTDGREGPGYLVHAYMDAAREVGGDFYDYYPAPDGRLVFLVADVSGKGIPAAIFMMRAKAAIKDCVLRAASLAEAAASANAVLSTHNSAAMFVTAWIGVYDAKAGAVEYVSAGHNPPLLRTADGSVRWLPGSRSPAFGVFGGARYRSAVERFVPGDTLFLYTDGVTEAMNACGELYGNWRLERALAQAGRAPIPDIIFSVTDFAAGAVQADDITMFTLEAKEIKAS